MLIQIFFSELDKLRPNDWSIDQMIFIECRPLLRLEKMILLQIFAWVRNFHRFHSNNLFNRFRDICHVFWEYLILLWWWLCRNGASFIHKSLLVRWGVRRRLFANCFKLTHAFWIGENLCLTLRRRYFNSADARCGISGQIALASSREKLENRSWYKKWSVFSALQANENCFEILSFKIFPFFRQSFKTLLFLSKK